MFDNVPVIFIVWGTFVRYGTTNTRADLLKFQKQDLYQLVLLRTKDMRGTANLKCRDRRDFAM